MPKTVLVVLKLAFGIRKAPQLKLVPLFRFQRTKPPDSSAPTTRRRAQSHALMTRGDWPIAGRRLLVLRSPSLWRQA